MRRRLADDYPTALVTGASSGIGTAFARCLARAGCSLVLVARSADALEDLARQLRAEHRVRVEVIPLDLTDPAPGAVLTAALAERGVEVDLLVNNAGFCTVGRFEAQNPRRERDEILLNAAAVVDLCHAFVPGMLARRRGAVINIASLAGFQALPYMSVYAATKAFVQTFSLGLWGELRGRGVHVLCVCPGPVDTPFYEATGPSGLRRQVPAAVMATAEAVAVDSLRALRRGRALRVPGIGNRVAATGSRLLPRALLVWITARVMRR